MYALMDICIHVMNYRFMYAWIDLCIHTYTTNVWIFIPIRIHTSTENINQIEPVSTHIHQHLPTSTHPNTLTYPWATAHKHPAPSTPPQSTTISASRCCSSPSTSSSVFDHPRRQHATIRTSCLRWGWDRQKNTNLFCAISSRTELHLSFGCVEM